MSFLERLRHNYNGLKDNDFFRLETSDVVEIKTLLRTLVYELWLERIFDWFFVCFKLLTWLCYAQLKNRFSKL